MFDFGLYTQVSDSGLMALLFFKFWVKCPRVELILCLTKVKVTLSRQSTKGLISCPLHICLRFFHERSYKYKAPSDDVQRKRTITLLSVFSSPEYEVLNVSYCDRHLSVRPSVRLQFLQTTSPPRPMARFQNNFTDMFIG